MASSTKSSPFSRAVVSAMRKLYPESLADKSFDNTGLLLEAPFNAKSGLRNSVLLTIDLTRAVAEEAIEKKFGAIVTYHPIIFSGLKSLTLANSQQASLLRLAAAGISVYSPHTAVDAAVGGNADWLADIVTGELDHYSHESQHRPTKARRAPESFGENLDYKLHTFPSSVGLQQGVLKLNRIPHVRKAIKPDASVENAGHGRIVEFEKPRYLSDILDGLLRYLGEPKAISVATPASQMATDIMISRVGICAGSGGSLLHGADVDLLLTGELVHHEALAAVESGKSVICLNHSNSERGYLGAVLKDRLSAALREEWKTTLERGSSGDVDMDGPPLDEAVEVLVSEKDRDPFRWLVSQDTD